MSQENLYKFMRRLLVRRFESSFGAFRKSVENQLAFLTRMKGFVEKSGVFIYASGVGKEIVAGTHKEIAKEKTKRKVVVFTEFKDTLDHLAAAFARTLMRDIAECGSLGISEYKLRQIWVRAKQGTGMLAYYIDRLWREGGGVDDYLAARKTTTAPRAVIVTVANG